MRDKRRKCLMYISLHTGEFITSLVIITNILYLEEGEEIKYDEPIPSYCMNHYDSNAKVTKIPTLKLLPIVEYITLTFTISPTNEI